MGVAAQDGRIRKGDRILRVDGVSLKGQENMKAASVLRNSGNPVRLTLSRRRDPVTKGTILGYLCRLPYSDCDAYGQSRCVL